MSDKTISKGQFGPVCPIPIEEYERVLLAHGGGGKLSAQLVEKMFLPEFRNEFLSDMHDGAILQGFKNRLAFTTDSYVVQPIFFPGGNIGDLAVNGTVNDLACCGAISGFISLGFIIEEGLEMETLWQIVQSIKTASELSGMMIVTGDTKVVDHGKGDKIFINTSGVGPVEDGINISPASCKPGDKILLSGTLADHGVAIMSTRAGLSFETTIESDTAPLNGMVKNILIATKRIRVFRDPTRGGLASSLNEISSSCGLTLQISEDLIPIREEVKGTCEILGLDPLYIANEGKLIAIVPEEEADMVLEAMKNHPLGTEAACIGEVTNQNKARVQMITTIGSSRIVDMISGEQLPRIC